MSRRAPPQALAAFVLHRYDWSETSLIVELFTRERGRVVVAAKGAKRPYSQLRPVLLPLQRITVTLGRSPADESAEVHLLRSAEWGGGPPMPTGEAIFRGFYLNELLLKLLARLDPHPALFDAYAQTLPAIAGADAAIAAAALRAFELVLLRETGVLPELDRVTTTREPLRAGQACRLHAELGLTLQDPHSDDDAVGAIDGVHWLALQQALAKESLAAVQGVCLEMATPLRLQLRTLLHYHLGQPTLRTRDAMIDLQRFVAPSASPKPPSR